jgi:hypothetical protein
MSITLCQRKHSLLSSTKHGRTVVVDWRCNLSLNAVVWVVLCCVSSWSRQGLPGIWLGKARRGLPKRGCHLLARVQRIRLAKCSTRIVVRSHRRTISRLCYKSSARRVEALYLWLAGRGRRCHIVRARSGYICTHESQCEPKCTAHLSELFQK